ncbi:hypothetical protein HanRHA438_Chr14g0647061 [Helianthus annuus]|nr:hypothetical protein HanRHA438_Chr14g0647061 [Helianthus annuus]
MEPLSFQNPLQLPLTHTNQCHPPNFHPLSPLPSRRRPGRRSSGWSGGAAAPVVFRQRQGGGLETVACGDGYAVNRFRQHTPNHSRERNGEEREESKREESPEMEQHRRERRRQGRRRW